MKDKLYLTIKGIVENVRRVEFWKKHKKEALCYGGTTLILLILYLSLVSPVVESNTILKSQITQTSLTISKYEEKLKESEKLKDTITNAQKELDALKGKLFPSNDPYQFTTKLEETIAEDGKKDIVIKSYQILSSKEYGLYQEVQYSLSFDANIYGISKFLDWLSKFETSVRINEFNLRYAPRGDQSNVDLIVNVNLTVLMPKKG